MDGWMGGWMDGWMDGWINGWMGEKGELSELIAALNICQTFSLSSVIIPASAEIPGRRRQACPAVIYFWATLEPVKWGWAVSLSAVIL